MSRSLPGLHDGLGLSNYLGSQLDRDFALRFPLAYVTGTDSKVVPKWLTEFRVYDSLVEAIAGPEAFINDRPGFRLEFAYCMTTLKENEQDVIALRFGLDDGHPQTLVAVGALMGRSRGRIWQIQVLALRKLRHPSRFKGLRHYLVRF